MSAIMIMASDPRDLAWPRSSSVSRRTTADRQAGRGGSQSENCRFEWAEQFVLSAEKLKVDVKTRRVYRSKQTKGGLAV
ncbi:MAG: hypothetical protein R6V03_10425 [Kiritimatiellia bacterium]